MRAEILFLHVLCIKNLFLPQAAAVEKKRLYIVVFNHQI